jgi:predicted DNA-binding transcriptional regulator AlpA
MRKTPPAVPAVIPPPINPADILTLSEVAERLKTSERWVYEKTRNRCPNPLPRIYIGRFLRFNWLDVSNWLRANTSGAGR